MYLRLREVIVKYAPDLAPPMDGGLSTSAIASEDGYLQTHLKATVEALWRSSDGSWEAFESTLSAEVGEQVRHEYDWLVSYCIDSTVLALIDS